MNVAARLNPLFIEEIQRTLQRTVNRAQTRHFGHPPPLAASIDSSDSESEGRAPLTQNYYHLLGVSPDADKAQIAQAAKQRAEELQRAYKILSHPQNRRIYDAKLAQKNAGDIGKITIRVSMRSGDENTEHL
jgi:Lon protease-like protein